MRVLLRKSVRLRGENRAGQPVDEKAETLGVSRHGALVKTRTGLRLDSEVWLENPETGASATFRVAWAKAKPLEGAWHTGLELTSGEPTFWGFKFPPE